MYERIVVGVHQAETAKKAAEHALHLGELTGAEVHLACALPDNERRAPLSSMVAGAALAGGTPNDNLPGESDARRHAEQFMAKLAHASSATSHVHVLPGDPVDVLVQVAEEVDADLVVVGDRGMKGARRVLGSVPNSISHQAPCSVLIVETT